MIQPKLFKKIMKSHNFTEEEGARFLGISTSTYKRWFSYDSVADMSSDTRDNYSSRVYVAFVNLNNLTIGTDVKGVSEPLTKAAEKRIDKWGSKYDS